MILECILGYVALSVLGSAVGSSSDGDKRPPRFDDDKKDKGGDDWGPGGSYIPPGGGEFGATYNSRGFHID